MSIEFIIQPPFGVEAIKTILPHRYPFLLLDGVTSLGDVTMDGFKNMSGSEEVFQGHFPMRPVFPGVLQIECLAQLGATWLLSQPANVGKIAYLMSVEGAKFRRPVLPGDRLDIHGDVLIYRGSSGKVSGTMSVNGQIASEATLAFAIGREDRQPNNRNASA